MTWFDSSHFIQRGLAFPYTNPLDWELLTLAFCAWSIRTPTAKDRRERLMERARRLYDDDWEIEVIAAELGYTQRGMKLNGVCSCPRLCRIQSNA
jgi:hypothetical protein